MRCRDARQRCRASSAAPSDCLFRRCRQPRRHPRRHAPPHDICVCHHAVAADTCRLPLPFCCHVVPFDTRKPRRHKARVVSPAAAYVTRLKAAARMVAICSRCKAYAENHARRLMVPAPFSRTRRYHGRYAAFDCRQRHAASYAAADAMAALRYIFLISPPVFRRRRLTSPGIPFSDA